MGWLQDGIALGNKWSDDAALKERQDKADARQATEDAWTTEERGRTREKNTREDNARKVSFDEAGNAIIEAGKPYDDSVWRTSLGIKSASAPMLTVGGLKDNRATKTATESTDTAVPEVSVVAPVASVNPESVNPTVPTQPAPKAENPFARQRADAISMMKIGQARGDDKMVFDAKALIQKVNINEGTTGITNWVLNASNDELKQAMLGIKLDPRNSYQPEFDPKTGITKIKSGAVEASFNREQLGAYLSARHRRNAGDPTAAADMKAVSAELAAQDELDYAKILKVGGFNNKVVFDGRAADNKDELMQARLSALSASTARAGAGGRQGQPGATEALHAGQPFNFTKEYENNLTHFRRIASGDGAMMGDPMTEKQIANKAMLQTQASKGEWDRVQTIETKSAMLIESVRGAKTPAQLSSIVSQAQSHGYNPEEIRRAIAQYSSLVK